MDEQLIRVWTAAADLEGLAAEVDQAGAGLDVAIADAIAADRQLREIGEAANLTESELLERIAAAGTMEEARNLA